MTDRDDSNEHSSHNFLERWSRRKIEAGQDEAKPSMPQGEVRVEPKRELRPEPKQASLATPVAKPEFDITKLPSLDSITAASDVRVFLAPGVPVELTRAALRRAWAADPTIRDFVGLAENAWDFTDPDAMMGFGELPADFDVKHAIAELFRETEKIIPSEQQTDANSSPSQIPQVTVRDASPETLPLNRREDETASASTKALSSAEIETKIDIVQRTDNFSASEDTKSGVRWNDSHLPRRHGRALPQ